MALVRFTRRHPRAVYAANAPVFPAFDEVEARMNRFMERMLNEPFNAAQLPEALGWMPAMDVVETTKEITLTAELPGIALADLGLSVEDGVLTIKGEKFDDRTEDEGKRVHLVERTYGAFERSFALPSVVDGAKISAAFDKGVLTIRLPKDGESKAKGHKIEIKG
jgi:HSP20 family protein